MSDQDRLLIPAAEAENQSVLRVTPMIRVQFETTIADWHAYQRHILGNIRGFTGKAAMGLSWRPIVLGAPIGLVVVVVLEVFDLSFHTPTAAITALVLVMFFEFFRRRATSALAPAADGIIIGPRDTSIDDDGVMEQATNHRVFTAWPGVHSVDETDDHVFVMVDRVAGYMVPKRAFRDSSEAAAFMAFARARAKAETQRA